MDHYFTLCDSKVARTHHKTETDSSETRNGAFSNMSCYFANFQALKKRPVVAAEMFGLIASTQRGVHVMLKQAGYS